ncbi:MAG: methyltransferase domain-containing protein [Brachybacterium paraconglomeratum]|nr:methyltransferase domain-containing protein [Brachybacterium paraconglomeratum]
MAELTEGKRAVRDVFDRAAPTYDQTGVTFFGLVGRHLVDIAAPRPGERVLDLGCGLGASALPAAGRVGPTGHVLGLDLAPAMVAGLAERARLAGLGQLAARVGDADDPDVGEPAWDVVQASLVLFFLDDLAAALRRHRALLRPGGRLVHSWFLHEDSSWDPVHAALVAEVPTTAQGPRRPGGGPFDSVAAMEATMAGAGYAAVRTEVREVAVTYPDAATWWATMWSHGRRALLERLEREGLLASTTRLVDRELARIAAPDGTLSWTSQIAFSVGSVPD